MVVHESELTHQATRHKGQSNQQLAASEPSALCHAQLLKKRLVQELSLPTRTRVRAIHVAIDPCPIHCEGCPSTHSTLWRSVSTLGLVHSRMVNRLPLFDPRYL